MFTKNTSVQYSLHKEVATNRHYITLIEFQFPKKVYKDTSEAVIRRRPDNTMDKSRRKNNYLQNTTQIDNTNDSNNWGEVV